MKKERYLSLLLAVSFLIGALTTSAFATEGPNNVTVSYGYLDYDTPDLSNAVYSEFNNMQRITKNLNVTVSPNSIHIISNTLDLSADDVVTFNCSYSPMAADVDFGLLYSNGAFYHWSPSNGTANQTFRISSAGSYNVAIRNNSAYTLSVTGYVNF